MKAKIELLFIPTVFALTIFVQCVLFHYLIYKEILLSSLWHSPLDFFRFYLPAATMAVFFSSFVFLFKNKWWTVVVSIFFNLWIWANLWYYRANGILIDKYAITMIGNLNGYWDSILALILPEDFVFLSLTIMLAITTWIWRERKVVKSASCFIGLICLVIVMGLTNGIVLVRKNQGNWSYMNPFKNYDYDNSLHRLIYSDDYIQDHTILHYFAICFHGYCCHKEKKYTMTDKETQKINELLNGSTTISNTSTPIIHCLIESFNSFCIREDFMPNLFKFVDTCSSILYAPHLISQAKGGLSADGQMINITGLLPLHQGAASMRFSYNTYPSISNIYSKSVCLLPHDTDMWNQATMSRRYGLDTNIVVGDNDKVLFNKTVELIHRYDYLLMLTLSSHIPCTKYSDSSALDIPDTIPTLLKNYIKSLNVLDQGMEILFREISTNKRLKSTTIVITGDHRLPVSIDEYFGGAYNYSHLIPLIIYSPEIKQKTIITDTCYQMDIYPTILHLIGCEDYYWKGFGVNLLDSAARHNRPITPEEAYDLSDKIIRADYFRKFEEQ